MVKPWSQVYSEDGVPRESEVQPFDWIRLVPIGGPEAARLLIAPAERDAHGRPIARMPVIDRKLVPPYDLMDANFAPDILCSERLVRALSDLKATGWTAEIVPHATPNRVFGHRVYKLSCEGWTGPIVNTAVKGAADAATNTVRAPEGAVVGRPIPPVSFDASLWTGHDLCWSPWFGTPPALWRALIVRGAVWLALCKCIPGRVMAGAERVTMLSIAHPQPRTPGRLLGPGEGPPPAPPTIAESIARIEREAQPYGHTVLGGASDADIRAAFAALSCDPPEELTAVLLRSNGPSIHKGALSFYPVTGKYNIAEMNHHLASDSNYPPHDGMIAFAEFRDGAIVWAINLKDRLVRGLGREGILYGPAAPFASWFADQLADLAYASDNASQIRWAYRMLWQ
jgi:hypothetical protein